MVREYRETIGEISDLAENLPINSCVFCISFVSYAVEYETQYEPSDCGTCHNIESNRYDDHVWYEDTCELFSYWKDCYDY